MIDFFRMEERFSKTVVTAINYKIYKAAPANNTNSVAACKRNRCFLITFR